MLEAPLGFVLSLHSVLMWWEIVWFLFQQD